MYLSVAWKQLSAERKVSRSSRECSQMIKMSSMYLFRRCGFLGWDAMNFSKMMDIKMFAMVGEKAAPIAVPLTCLKVMGPNSKKFEVTLVCSSLIIRFGSNRSRCFLACISS